MKQELILTSQDILEYQTLAIFGSKKARNMLKFNTLGIFAELMIAFFIIEQLFSIKYLSVAGIVLGVLWLIFYPKFLKQKRLKILKRLKNENELNKTMFIELFDDEFSFYENEAKERFAYSQITEIYETAGVYVVYVGTLYIILPKPKCEHIISALAKKSGKYILKFENLNYQNVIEGKF
ncbi:YcxB family protein [Campylobacter mucosalis]|uniref:YcxB family protein n=1 Tax=Campylobacter mucosalis TaxID=202 RepID=UPI00146FEF7C|nr:YcxB family protein [Campylobacter mucosalis]